MYLNLKGTMIGGKEGDDIILAPPVGKSINCLFACNVFRSSCTTFLYTIKEEPTLNELNVLLPSNTMFVVVLKPWDVYYQNGIKHTYLVLLFDFSIWSRYKYWWFESPSFTNKQKENSVWTAITIPMVHKRLQCDVIILIAFHSIIK